MAGTCVITCTFKKTDPINIDSTIRTTHLPVRKLSKQGGIMQILRNRWLCFLLIAAMAPQIGWAASPTDTPIVDVMLHDNGTLHGRLVDRQQNPVSQRRVELQPPLGGAPIATATTGTDGWFQVNGVRGGVYRLASAGDTGILRTWAPNTAPPTAHPAVKMVSCDSCNAGLAPGYGAAPACESGGFPWGKAALIGVAAVGITWAIIELTDDDDNGS
jgi:hypothetical protein